MLEVDGFTLIDYIKSSIEILMNMKIEEGGGPNDNEPDPNHEQDEYEMEEEELAEERRQRRRAKKEAKKL